MRQLFLNILTNAADAMPEGGTITVRVAPGAGDPAGVVVELADTGVGIAEEDLAKVMDPFYTTKPEGQGTGLGLGIRRRIVEEHQGQLQILSNPARERLFG
ncbi:MAG TPA: ATP-binding protein [Blastocatellia bacterium]|nr:ATP-binding protein [Blastocatellia bacterium]